MCLQLKFRGLGKAELTLKLETNLRDMVNVNARPYVDKDQALVFLHILSNRHNGHKIPRTLPASLRASLSSESVDYNVSRAGVRKIDQNDGEKLKTASGRREAFADSYLTRLGVNSDSITSHQQGN